MRADLLQGDCLQVLPTLPERSVHTVVTSPPYFGLRDYGNDGQIGLEPTPAGYVAALCAVFDEVWRVLRDDGTLWLNLGDSFCSQGGPQVPQTANAKRVGGSDTQNGGRSRTAIGGLKPKDLIGIPWRVAFALQERGWYLRSDIIWSKPNPMPESVTDRPTRSHEYIFLLSKSARYHYDAEAIKEPQKDVSAERAGRGRCETMKRVKGAPGQSPHSMHDPRVHANKQDALGKQTYTGFNARWRDRPTETRNKRSVWEISPKPFKDSHFAVFPPDLITPCILAGCPAGGTVLDPFSGSGTTVATANSLGRNGIGIELNLAYIEIAKRRLRGITLPLMMEAA